MEGQTRFLAALSIGAVLLVGASGLTEREPQAQADSLLPEAQTMLQVPKAALPSLPDQVVARAAIEGRETAGQRQSVKKTDQVSVAVQEPGIPHNGEDAAMEDSVLLVPEASGVSVKKDAKSVIDYSNTRDGYVMVNFTAPTVKRLKAQVKGPTTTYTYDLTAGKWEVFPLSDGSGEYQVKVFENVVDTKYLMVSSLTHTVELTDEFAPFIRPNQYVDYAQANNTIVKAQEVTAGLTGTLEKVAAVYDYVVSNVSYDYDKAASVKSGYLPVLDDVLESKKGICFDYAALMTGMLRSQGVPCKLVVGYAGEAYHAWISVWSETEGWIEGVVFFDGAAWQRMDPTYASTGQQTQWIIDYINNDANYTAKYLY